MEYFWKKKTIVSFFLALLVIFIHSAADEQYILQLSSENGKDIATFASHIWTNTLARVAVPLFFVLSGATFFRVYKPGMYKKKLISRVKSLFIPYLIWNIVGMCFEIVCAYTPIHRFFIGREPFVITVPNIIEAIFFYKCNYVFWFMYNLIIYIILTPVFDILTSKKWTSYLAAIGALSLPIFAPNGFVPVKMDANAVVFYMIGCMIGKYYFDAFSAPSSKKGRIIGGVVCLACMALQMLNIYNVFHLPSAARQVLDKCGILSFSPIANQMLLIVFCLAFWKAIDRVVEHLDVKEYMKISFLIYALHPNVQVVLVKCIYLIGPKKIWMMYPNMVISYLITVAFIIAVAAFWKKMFPKTFSVATGSWR